MEGKAFLLRPDTPKEGKLRTLRPGESNELSEPMRTYAQEAGLVMRRPSLTSYAMYALEATEYAQQQGMFDPFHRAMYKALWEDGKDLGNLEVIRDVAKECGLNWQELGDALESRHYQDTVMSQFQEAVSMGIRGIPAFLVGNILFTGASPYEIFRAVMNKYLEQEAIT